MHVISWLRCACFCTLGCLGFAGFWVQAFGAGSSLEFWSTVIQGLLVLGVGLLWWISLSATDPQSAGKASNSVPFALTALVIATLFLYLITIDIYPLWASEAMILDDARSILTGNLINPLANTGDFPSRFMAYPVAPLLPIFNDPRVSSRIPGIFYLLVFSVLVVRTAKLIRRDVFASSILFPLLSIWLFNLGNTADNNWLSGVPLLSLAPLYLYLRIRIETSSHARLVPLLALAIALGCWTLYMPLIAAVTVLVLFILDSSIPTRVKVQVSAIVFALCLPTLGRIVAAPQVSVGRHSNFLTQVGEGELNMPMLAGYARTLAVLADRLVPSMSAALNPNRTIFLEPTTGVLIVLGVLAIMFSSSVLPASRRIYFLFFFGNLVGLVISNPVGSFWRTSILAPQLFIAALIGFAALLNTIGNIRCRSVVMYALLLMHCGVFAYYYSPQVVRQFSRDNIIGERFVLEVYEQCMVQMEPGATVSFPPGYPTFVPRIMSHNRWHEVHVNGAPQLLLPGEANVRYQVVRATSGQLTPPTSFWCAVVGRFGDLRGWLIKSNAQAT
jgi:hypothetical protein